MNRSTRRFLLATAPMFVLLGLFAWYAVRSSSPAPAHVTTNDAAEQANRNELAKVRAKREAVLSAKAAKGRLDVMEAEELQELRQQDKTDEMLKQFD
jgi:hypothetical protein